MTRSISPWALGIAAAALLALPAAGVAQTPPTEQPPVTTPPTTPPAAPAQTPTSPAGDQTHQSHSANDHLKLAKTVLNGIQVSSVTGTARTKLTELKKHMASLERSVAANDNASATATTRRSPRATAARGASNWGSEVAVIDRLLTEMVGATGTPVNTDPAATTGTTGATRATGAARGSRAAAAVTVDDATRAQLTEVRTHITAFAAAMSGTAAAAPAAAADPAAATPATTTSPAGTQPPAEPPAATSTTTATTATPTTSRATTTKGAAAKVDADAAKSHLTAARDTLSQLTQLPEAAQLTGDARTQVAAIITDFNTLITTQTEWRVTFAKLQTSLTALLGAEGTAPAAAPATGTPGAVGTSGPGTLDPKVRERLVEFRSKLADFERVAGARKQ